jgi:hypothetical protein
VDDEDCSGRRIAPDNLLQEIEKTERIKIAIGKKFCA